MTQKQARLGDGVPPNRTKPYNGEGGPKLVKIEHILTIWGVILSEMKRIKTFENFKRKLTPGGYKPSPVQFDKGFIYDRSTPALWAHRSLASLKDYFMYVSKYACMYLSVRSLESTRTTFKRS